MRKWNIRKPDERHMCELAEKGGLTSLTSAVLVSRGFGNMESVMQKFEIRELSDPFLMTDMDRATDKINSAIEDGTKICIYGDYDCDGIMSTVMLYTFLSEIGADVSYYIPEREEGYGLNENAVRLIAERGSKLIITVDNGISAVNEAELIYELGMELVITDHHQVGETLPRAEAIVNPHRHDCYSPFKALCGAGVVLKLIAGLNGGDYSMALEQFADLTAIATVADIVDLSSENRYIVESGLRLIENTERVGLIELLKVSGLFGKKINSNSIGFMIAPRINASGRFGSPKTAVKLLLSDDEKEAKEIAEELNNLNEMRKNEEKLITNEINEQVNKNNELAKKRVLVFFGKGWSHGVIGIVASKIEELYGKPCFIVSEINGEMRGSARSFGEFSTFKALEYCKDFLVKYGGHQGAGGFTVKEGMADEFDSKLQEYASINHQNMPVLSYNIDYVLTPNEITIENIKGLELLEPFGFGNEAPLFMINNAYVENIISISEGKHSKLLLRFGSINTDALVFGYSPEKLGISVGDVYSFIVRLDINEYNSREYIRTVVVDFRKHGIKQAQVISANNAYEFFVRGETLPLNYYKAMYPLRENVVTIYKKIPEKGINIDMLYTQVFSDEINYCKMLITLDALKELSLIRYDYSVKMVYRLKTDKKVDLNSAPTLIKLKEKTGG